MRKIQLLDGKKILFEKSIDGFEIIKKISKSLEKSALIMEVDGKLRDLSFQIQKDSKVKIVTSKLNKWLNFIQQQNPPPLKSGRVIKIKYCTQTSIRPPTFTFFSNLSLTGNSRSLSL